MTKEEMQFLGELRGKALSMMIDQTIVEFMQMGCDLEGLLKVIRMRWEKAEAVAPAHLLERVRNESADRNVSLDRYMAKIQEQKS